MNFKTNIAQEEYEAFVSQHQKSHFMQSYSFGEIRKIKNFIPHYVGLYDNNQLIAAALLLEKKLIKNYSYLYSPRGYVIDFENLELVKTFTEHIREFAKEKKAVMVRIDPDFKLHNLSIDGEIIGNSHQNIVSYLKTLGYHHNGFTRDFNSEQPRFTFRLDLTQSKEDIHKNLHPTTRKILNKKNQFDLDIYVGSIDDFDLFYETMKETAKREGLLQLSMEYYKSFYTTLHENGMSDLYLAKVNINRLKEIYENKLQNLELELESLSNSKYKNKNKLENKIKEYENQIGKIKKDKEKLNEIKEEEITLSSIITVKYGDKVWTVHGGNHSLLMELNANYLLYYTIIMDAKEQGYKIVDFFGTNGNANPNPNDSIYGIHLFKKRFGGEYTEFIGEFDLIINKVLYFAFIKLMPIYHKIKNKKSKS